MRGGCSFRARQILLIVVIVATFTILWSSYQTAASFDPSELQRSLFEERSNITVEVVNTDESRGKSSKDQKKDKFPTGKCNIPKLEMYGAEVAGFFKDPAPLNCDKGKKANWAFVDEQGAFALIPERKTAKCTGVVITRKDDDHLRKSESVDLQVGAPLPGDFVIVDCKSSGEYWSGMMMSAVPSPERVKALKALPKPEDWSGLNVYFLGFDSLSHMSFRRKLPKTVDFLEKELGSVVLNGYNIVGDGTPQAFIPILTAGTETELPLTRKRFRNANYVDDVYPFAWRNFSDAGYATTYGEDAAAIGTFTYRLKGFRNQPTDHYTRTFFQEAEKRESNMRCLGSEPLHKSWFRYSREFMRRYKDIPRFLVMHHSMNSHDDINQVAVMDDDIESNLRTLHSEGAFDNALVVVMADHGHRFAKLRETHQGQLEERLPFFSLALPKAFRESDKGREAYANLLANKDRLTTPFDIHATLMDILHWPTDFTTVQTTEKQRSLSLWQPIPESRTCDQAGVEPHWCTCLDWQDAMTESDKELSMEIARAAVSMMNDQTAKERKLCAPLRLHELISAKKLVPNEDLLKYKNVKDADGFVPDLSGTTKATFAHYQLKLSTRPGRANYEITVMYYAKERKLEIDLASLSHVNKFGDDPHCIIDKNYFLATFCVCYDKVQKE